MQLARDITRYADTSSRGANIALCARDGGGGLGCAVGALFVLVVEIGHEGGERHDGGGRVGCPWWREEGQSLSDEKEMSAIRSARR